MKPCPVTYTDMAEAHRPKPGATDLNNGQSFDDALRSAIPGVGCQATDIGCSLSGLPHASPAPPLSAARHHTPAQARAAYMKLQGSEAAGRPQTNPMSGWQKYRDDQLLRNPGGRYYYTDQRKVVENPGPKPVSWLIGRDISGVVGNIRNFFANMFEGSTILYRGEKNQIRQGHQTGLLGTLGHFFKDLASALSFGAYHPKSQQEPHGFENRLLYSASRLKQAFLGDLIEGVPSSVNHMAQNAILSGWRLVEVLPDAAIGSFEPGRKLTTTIFDDGQVAVEYLTDVAPSGDAWLRVHASDWEKLKPPVLYNLKMPEHFNGDVRWRYVRNTPFRKTIETIGALVADGLSLGLLGHTGGSSCRRKE